MYVSFIMVMLCGCSFIMFVSCVCVSWNVSFICVSMLLGRIGDIGGQIRNCVSFEFFCVGVVAFCVG